MKNNFLLTVLMLLLAGYTLPLAAQLSSSLTPAQLLFSDQSNPLASLGMSISGINIQNNFNITSITDNSVSAGSDLIQSRIDGSGFTIQDFAVFPASNGHLNRKELNFQTEGAGLIGLDRETWRFGITDVGDYDESDPVESALFLTYNRIIDDIAIFHPVMYVTPNDGSVGIGTFNTSFNAQLYVQEFGQEAVSIWSTNTSIGSSAKWGIYSIAEGGGDGVRYGVVGSAATGSGTNYGVFGSGSGAGTVYAVYASGNMAYTGTLTDVSDRKFKKNIREFSALERIMQLRPKTYEMKRDEFKGMNLANGLRYGFIAQELQEVFPELVQKQVNATPYQEADSLNVEEIDYLGVEYIPMIPVLTKGMQEQQEQIEEKEERLTKLEHQNQALERENQELENRLDQLEILVQQLSQQTSGGGNTTTTTISDARLDQNQPNPFNNSTSIPYFIPNTVQSAVLEVTDAQGRVLKSLPITDRGQGKTILETDLLSGGVYFYSLSLDGKVVDTKKMIAVK